MATDNQVKTPSLHIYCRSEKRTLQSKNYDSVNNLKKDALALYGEGNFHNENAILTYLDENQTEVLLTIIPDSSKKNCPKDLFIRFVCTLLPPTDITRISI